MSAPYREYLGKVPLRGVQLRASQLSDFLVKLYFKQASLKQGGTETSIVPFLLGPSGVGKTAAVYEAAERIAKELGKKLKIYDVREKFNDEDFIIVDFRLYEAEVTDLIGIPRKREDEDTYEYVPPRWAKVLAEHPGILFLDELTNASMREEIMAAAFKIVGERKVGFLNFKNDVFIICAGNPADVSSIAGSLPRPLKYRLMFVEVAPPTVKEWIAYMNRKYGDNWDTRVAAFLQRFPDKFSPDQRRDQEEELVNYPNPRAWSRLALLMKGENDWKTIKVYAYSVLGREASSFLAFVKNNPPSVEEVMENPRLLNKMNQDQLYMFGNELAQRLESTPPSKLTPYVQVLDHLAGVSPEVAASVLRTLPAKRRKKVLAIAFHEGMDSLTKMIEEVMEVREKYGS